MGTELEQRGADLNDPLWSGRILRDQPDWIQAVHADHLAAGADVVISASYQIADDAGLLTRSVAVARAACEAHARGGLVAASLGPYGAFLADGSEYSGDYGVDSSVLVDFHQRRIGPLVRAGADLLAFETIPSLQEAEAIAAVLARDEWAQVSAWVSFSCRDGEQVSSGDSFGACVAAVAALDTVVAVGVNCTAPEHVESLLRIADQVSSKPLVAYPNRGAAWDGVNKTWCEAGDSPPAADWALKYYALGARFIGGCCQTTPADIEAIRAALERRPLPD